MKDCMKTFKLKETGSEVIITYQKDVYLNWNVIMGNKDNIFLDEDYTDFECPKMYKIAMGLAVNTEIVTPEGTIVCTEMEYLE